MVCKWKAATLLSEMSMQQPTMKTIAPTLPLRRFWTIEQELAIPLINVSFIRDWGIDNQPDDYSAISADMKG